MSSLGKPYVNEEVCGCVYTMGSIYRYSCPAKPEVQNKSFNGIGDWSSRGLVSSQLTDAGKYVELENN